MASLRFMALLCVLCSSVLITNGLTAEEEQAALEEEIFQETLAAGRGEREAQGVRDQWEVKSGIGGKEDTRKPISKKVRSMMEDNGLSCPGCSHKEAVAMVNAFIKEEQKRLAY